MTYAEFDKLYEQMVKEENEIGASKGVEYTQAGDRLDNFKRLAKELGIQPELVLWIYLKKHLDGICKFIRTGTIYSEPIEGRIKDARVYLALLRGLIEERKGDK